MTDASYVFDVSAADFQHLVLEQSRSMPVLVDFWAAWCQPCQMLMPMLKRLAEQYRGVFALVKVNTDVERELAARYGIRSLPTVKVFRHGQVVDELIGVQPESVYRQVIEHYRAKPSDELRLQARNAWLQGARGQAVALLRQACELEPDDGELALELAEWLLALGQVSEAQDLLRRLPPALASGERARALQARLAFAALAASSPEAAELENRIARDPDDCEARRQLAARRVLAGDFEAALAQFLAIVQRDPGFADGAGRKGLLAIFDILGPAHPLTGQYRRRLAAALL
ncbi:MAG TPA: thioredoxin [Candidatus Competibacteraceae bacterium]|nr:thioredoxin [Candidatus Competibacteraceae bacterium]